MYVCFGAWSHAWYCSSQVRISQMKRAVVKHLGSLVTRAPEFEHENWSVCKMCIQQDVNYTPWIMEYLIMPFCNLCEPPPGLAVSISTATCGDVHQFQQIFSICPQLTKPNQSVEW